MNTSAKLIFLCGKMAAGKSTLARDLAKRENAILLVQDEFLDALFPGEITDLPGFVKCSSRLRSALAPHVCAPARDFRLRTESLRWLLEKPRSDPDLVSLLRSRCLSILSMPRAPDSSCIGRDCPLTRRHGAARVGSFHPE